MAWWAASPPHSDILRRLVLLIGVVGYFLVLRPLQQALPDLYFSEIRSSFDPKRRQNFVFRLTATPLPRYPSP